MEWMEFDLLWNFGGMLRSMIKVDLITESQARGRFAKICVEVDVTKPLRGSLNIDGRKVMVEYESMRGLICFNCGRIGHGRESYSEGIQPSRNYQGHGSSRNGAGGRSVRTDNRDLHRPFNVKSGDKPIARSFGPTVAKPGAAVNLEKGKWGAAKKKGVLSKVTNLKLNPSSSKKPIKPKVIAPVGDGSHIKKKSWWFFQQGSPTTSPRHYECHEN
ncbi:hypothetical protein ACOSQ3_003305 [Xanthoceras sorbifolium]